MTEGLTLSLSHFHLIIENLLSPPGHVHLTRSKMVRLQYCGFHLKCGGDSFLFSVSSLGEEITCCHKTSYPPTICLVGFP